MFPDKESSQGGITEPATAARMSLTGGVPRMDGRGIRFPPRHQVSAAESNLRIGALATGYSGSRPAATWGKEPVQARMNSTRSIFSCGVSLRAGILSLRNGFFVPPLL